jgi:YggT family protein
MFAVRLLIAAIDVYSLVLVVRILLSWAPEGWRANVFCEFLHAITEPVLKPFRRLLKPIGGMDFSPILLFILLAVVEHLLRGR